MSGASTRAAAGAGRCARCRWSTSQYQARQLFIELERAQSPRASSTSNGRSCSSISRRWASMRASKRSRAQRPAHGAADARAHPIADGGGANDAMRRSARRAAAKGVPFSASPVLAVKLPAWRSRWCCSCCSPRSPSGRPRALAAGHFDTDFLQKQGESRYARTLELPATRGKITDRNGEVLPSRCRSRRYGRFPTSAERAARTKLH